MVNAAQVTELLERGHSYESAAHALHIAPGLAYMLATGRPADASGDPPPADPARGPRPAGSPQQLVNPPQVNPTQKESAMEWVRVRAARELERPS
jgi:hypothetical protein